MASHKRPRQHKVYQLGVLHSVFTQHMSNAMLLRHAFTHCCSPGNRMPHKSGLCNHHPVVGAVVVTVV